MVPLVCHVAEPPSLRVVLVSFPMCGLKGLTAGSRTPSHLVSTKDSKECTHLYKAVVLNLPNAATL